MSLFSRDYSQVHSDLGVLISTQDPGTGQIDLFKDY